MRFSQKFWKTKVNMEKSKVALIAANKKDLDQIEGWLKSQNPTLELTTFTSPEKAIVFLRSLPELDQIISSETFPEVGGLVWIKALKKLYPHTLLTVVATKDKPTEKVRTLVSEYEQAEYLTKPIKLENFQHEENLTPVTEEIAGVEDETGSLPDSFEELGVVGLPAGLSDDQHQQMGTLLKDIQENVNAHSIYLVDHLGQSLVHIGNAASKHIVEIATLLGGSFAALLEVGEIVDENKSSMNLIYRQGEKDDVYALSVASNYLLILLIARGPYATRVGTVWYYVREVAPALAEILQDTVPGSKQPKFTGEMTAALDQELDAVLHTGTLKLPESMQDNFEMENATKDKPEEDWPFAMDDLSATKVATEQSFPSVPASGELVDLQNAADIDVQPEDAPLEAATLQDFPVIPGSGELLDLESAGELGIIPEDILQKLTAGNVVELASGELKAD
jgi:hypothetical protein